MCWWYHREFFTFRQDIFILTFLTLSSMFLINQNKVNYILGKISYLDFSYKIKYMTSKSQFNALIKHAPFREFLSQKLGFNMNTEKNKDIWEAFIFSRDKNYPTPSTDDIYLEKSKAEVFVDKLFVANTLKDKADKGILRKNARGWILKKDLEYLLTLFTLKDLFLKSGSILPTKGVRGEDVFAVIPKKINRLGKNEREQEMLALKKLLEVDNNRQFVLDFIANL